ncbi:hypothetical protein AnigIFM60653_011506 [Aspergillus niger]|nr:hypothetical protein AnigIFM60653_011506 [Aspergillus niger]
MVGKQFEFEDQRDGIVPPLEEKKVIDEVYTDNDAASEEIVKDWDDKEEGKLRRKIDIILIPILALAFFGLQIDRGNISAALTSTITEDLGVTTNQINIGTQLLSAGIVITEIPSNIILQRIGPQVWLSAQLIAWGLVGTFQAFVQSYPAYLATRLLLGLLEGGFIPGALYYLSTWYKRPETSFRTTLFFYGQMFAGATSSLISAGLLKLDGKCGLAGWRWIFLVEGLITIFAAILFILFIPKKAGDGSPLISMGRWSYFSPREKRIILDRVLLDDPLKTREHIKITGRDIWKTVTQTTTLQHMLITLVAMSGFQGLNTYTPSMIKSFGFSAVRANALASVPVMHVLNVGWLSFYCKTPQERSISMALIVMSANLSGISGAQIFRSSDAPLYIHGLTAICALAAASWVQTLVLNLQYLFRRKKTQAGTV